MIVETKAAMYELYERGKFGNRLRTWKNLADYQASDHAPPVVLRYKGKAGGAWCEYSVPRDRVEETVRHWESEGADRSLVTVNESADDSRLTIQGEVMRSADYMALRYSTVKKPMRKALAECQHHTSGLTAKLILETHLAPASLDDLHLLLDEYDGAVVEFSAYEMEVGDCLGRNTIFWEVRHY